MERFKRQAVLLALLNTMRDRGSWCGETHIQKCTFFLQEGLDVPLDLQFILYKHGPFSFELSKVLGEMRGNFLIDVASRRPYGPRLFVSESGGSLKARFPNTIRRYATEIDFVAENLATRDVVELERLGTALYVKRMHPNLSTDHWAHKIIQLKPHIQIEQARSAVSTVEELFTDAGCSIPEDGRSASRVLVNRANS